MAGRISLFCLFYLVMFITSAQTTVTVKPASTLTYYPERSAPAEVVALNNSFIPAEISAKVNEILVNVGQQVEQGTLLVMLDCQSAKTRQQLEQAKLKQLQHQANFAAREFNRGKVLAQQKNISAAELDSRNNNANTSQALLAAQKAALQLADIQVERCAIKAPFNGVVVKRIANEGEMIDIGKPVLALLEQNNLQVSAKVSLSDFASFTQANSYQLTIMAKNYPLTLAHILPVIEKNNRSQAVRFNFNDKSPIAGSIGRVTWRSVQRYLPAHLFVSRAKQNGYFIADNNKAKFIPVSSAEEGRPLPFTLSQRVQIIIEGRHGLIDGEAIHIVNNNKAAD